MKILIRSGISPLDKFSPGKIIVRNSFGGNISNLTYQFGVYRALTTNTTKIIPDAYNIESGIIKDAKKVNKKYTSYICPMADTFRRDSVDILKKYSDFAKKLDIPFVVDGVGLRTELEGEGCENFPFDDVVHDFVSTIHENCLTNLGFKEGKEFMVTGCPSMFSFGNNIKIRNTNITKNSGCYECYFKISN